MFDEEIEELPDAQMSELTDMAQALIEQRAEIGQLEEALMAASTEEKRLSEIVIPAKMLSLNLQSITLSNGAKLEIKHKFVGSIPKDPDKRIRAFDWLISHNLEDIIKNEIRCDFKKGEGEVAQKVIDALTEIGVDWSRKKDVHHQTLKASAKDLLSKGIAVPLDTLGLFEIDQTHIKL